MSKRSQIQQRQLELLIELDHVCKEHNIRYFLMFGTLLGAVRHQGFIPWDDDVDVIMLPADFEKFNQLTQSNFHKGFFLKNVRTEQKRFDYWSKLAMDNTAAIDLRLADIDVHWGISLDIFPLFPLTDKRNLETQEKLVRKMKFLCRKPLYKNYNYKITSKQKILGVLYACMPYVMRNALYEHYLHRLLFPKGELQAYGDYGDNVPKGFVYPKACFDTTCEISFEETMYPAPNEYKEILKILYGDHYMELPPVHQRISHDNVYYDFDIDYRKVKYYE